METIMIKLLQFGGIPILMFIVGWLVGKYVKPWIHNADHPSRLAWAKELALLADRVTDELVVLNPGATWDDLINDAIDRVIEKLGITDMASMKARAVSDEVAYCLRSKGIITAGFSPKKKT